MEIRLWRVQVAQSYSQAAATKTKQITAVIRFDRMNDDDDYLLSLKHTPQPPTKFIIIIVIILVYCLRPMTRLVSL